MACEAMGPTWEEMATFTWEKSWIWRRPVPAQPMTWPATASGMVRIAVMQGSFMEGMELIACWGQRVDIGVVQGFLRQQGGLARGLLEEPGVVVGPGVEGGSLAKKLAANVGSWQMS